MVARRVYAGVASSGRCLGAMLLYGLSAINCRFGLCDCGVYRPKLSALVARGVPACRMADSLLRPGRLFRSAPVVARDGLMR